MALKYRAGQEIRQGDRVTYGGNAGVIELVVEGLVGDPARDWLFKNHGAGIMVAEPKVSGAFTSRLLMRRRTCISLVAQSDVRTIRGVGKERKSRSSRWRTCRAGTISRIWNLRF
jgi:hypothetical protein